MALPRGLKLAAEFVFPDPPYNVAIDGNVCGLGRVHEAILVTYGRLLCVGLVKFKSPAGCLASPPCGLWLLRPLLGSQAERDSSWLWT